MIKIDTVRNVVAYLFVGAYCMGAHAWPGFEWERWKEQTGAERVEIDSAQAGVPHLLPLLSSTADAENDIDTPEAWEAKRDRIMNALAMLIGEPMDIQVVEVAADIHRSVNVDGYTRTHVTIPGEEGDPIPAYLLMPDEPIDDPCPVMIVLHQTQAPGKREACGMTGDPEMAFAAELAKRGYVCIAPDVIGFGERIPEGTQPYHGAHDFYARHPDWSFFGKMNWDVSRVVDFIETLPDVDPKRIGVIGHSHGAYGGLMGAVHEPRIAAAVISCGFTTLRSDPNPNRWSHLTALLPRVGFYVDDIARAPFDWHEVLACMAPRPCFVWATRDDRIFPNTDNFEAIYDQVEDVYELYGASDNFVGNLAPGEHKFPKDARDQAYAWLAEHFGVE